ALAYRRLALWTPSLCSSFLQSLTLCFAGAFVLCFAPADVLALALYSPGGAACEATPRAKPRHRLNREIAQQLLIFLNIEFYLSGFVSPLGVDARHAIADPAAAQPASDSASTQTLLLRGRAYQIVRAERAQGAPTPPLGVTHAV